MVYLLSLWITSLVMGFSLMDQNDQNQRSWPGLFFLMGFYLLIMAMFSANVILHIPLTLSAKFILFIALAWFAYSKQALFRMKDFWLGLLSHPIVLYFVVFCIVILFLGMPDYKISEGDEVSYWMFMPKKIIFLDQIKDVNFPYQNYYQYTPGWPLVLAYPQLLMSQPFNPGPMIYAAWFVGFALCCFIFDLLVHALPSLGNFNKKFIAWWGLLLLCFLRAFGPVIPTDVLVEPPIAYAFISTLLLIFVLVQNYLNSYQVLSMLGLAMATGYLIKTPYSSMLAPAAIIGLVWIYKNLDAETKFQKIKQLCLKSILLLGPVIMVAVSWKYYIREIAVQMPVSNLSLDQIFPSRNYVFPRMFESLISFFQKTRHAMGLPGIVLGLFFARHRILSIASIAFYALYLAGLAWVYLAVFGDYESGRLASFYRYNLVATWALTLIGLFITLEILLSFKFIQWPFKFRFTKHFMAVVVLTCSLGLAYKLFEKAQKHYRQIAELKPFPVMEEAKILLKQLDHRLFANRPYGFIISQGEAWGEVSDGWFASFDQGKIFYELSSKYSWNHDTVPEIALSELRKADFIWPRKSDAFMDEILTSLVGSNDCPPPYNQYFLWRDQRSSPVTFNCSLKKDSVDTIETAE